jgi:hypothetical protein
VEDTHVEEEETQERSKEELTSLSHSSSSSSRLLRSRSIYHSKSFECEVQELASHCHTMNELKSNEMGTCHGEPPLSHESTQHSIDEEACKACGSVRGTDSIDLESPCEIAPLNLLVENESSSKHKNCDATAHHSQEFMDFL